MGWDAEIGTPENRMQEVEFGTDKVALITS